MQFSSFYKVSTLLVGLGISGCGVAATDAPPKGDMALAGEVPAQNGSQPTGATETRPEAFPALMQAAKERGDWPALLAGGRRWQKISPQEPAAFFAEAQATHMLGDVEAAIAAWEKLIEKFPSTAPSVQGWLKTARAVRANFPNLKLQPLQFEPGDAAREQTLWRQKGESLLAAKSYDEIEKVAAQLQKSNASNVKGSPYLSSFFEGLTGEGPIHGLARGGSPKIAPLSELQKRVAAWRTARPQSTLARLVSIELLTDAATESRGDGEASTITPAMQAKMEAALRSGERELKTLPKSAFGSPLAFIVALDWGLLAGAPREFLDPLFTQGTASFPNYLPLYRTRALHLLPRWTGEPGEALAMIEKRADQIGDDNGDVFYGRVVWHLSQTVGNLARDFNFDYPRAARGLAVLSKRYPDSMSVSSARLALAYRAKDWKVGQEILSSARGYILDNTWERWAVPHNQSNFAEQRILILGETP